MRTFASLLIALVVGASTLLTTGCAASGPPPPTLPTTLSLKLNDYEEAGGILPITGMLELVIQPSGEAKSSCLRQILTNVVRSGDLSREQRVELVTRVEAWSAKVGDLPGSGKNHGFLTYGTKRAAWQKDDSLPPELDALVKFLLTIPPTLRVERPRR